MSQLNAMIKDISCPSCSSSTLSFSRNTQGRLGFSYVLELKCTTCDLSSSKVYSSCRTNGGEVSKPFVVDDLLVLFFNQQGQGHTAQKKFASLFGWDGLHTKTFQKKECQIISAIIDNTDDVLRTSVSKVKAAYLSMDPDVSITPLCITVSFDGSWHKRGHTSSYGVAAVIDIYAGLVVDYVVLSKYCHACSMKKAELGPDSQLFHEWYESHKDCAINYTGTSNGMEVEAARRLWSRSEERHGLRYTGFLSDGDSKAHKAVVEMKVYEEDIQKQECVNHIHKRMGTALRNLTKQKKLGGRGFGRLTQDRTIHFQNYYRMAVQRNLGNPEAMRQDIWATLFHCMSTDAAPQHSKCPAHKDSWCFYQKAIARQEDVPSHKDKIRHPLNVDVAREMIPVYERLTDPNLMERMKLGKTQNSNESLHNVIWSRCPKTTFVGKHKLHGAVASAVAAFNEGAVHTSQVLRKRAIEPHEILNIYNEQQDALRVVKSRKSSTLVSKRRRTEKWVADRQRRHQAGAVEGPSYVPGRF